MNSWRRRRLGSFKQPLYDWTIDMKTVTVSPKFQIVIPEAIRDRLELRPSNGLEHYVELELWKMYVATLPRAREE